MFSHFSLPEGLKDRQCVFGDLESPDQGLEHSRCSVNVQTEEGCFQESNTGEADARGADPHGRWGDGLGSGKVGSLAICGNKLLRSDA